MTIQNKNTPSPPLNDITAQDIKLPWHPVFHAALHIEFEEESEHFYFHNEYYLSKEPMRMDILVIKKDPNVQIQKNIGQIFRTYNIIEYKPPGDSLSFNDFYKVYGYACFFQADTGNVGAVDPEEITITYVCYHFPRKMVKHIAKARHIAVRDREDGIYDLVGDPFTMQLIVVSELSPERNFWLSYLRKDLKRETDIRDLLSRYKEKKNSPYYQAVMDLILKANLSHLKEVRQMFEEVRELFKDEFREAEERGITIGEKRGITIGEKRGITIGEERGIIIGEKRAAAQLRLTKNIFKLALSGASVSDIARQCNVSEDYVRETLE